VTQAELTSRQRGTVLLVMNGRTKTVKVKPGKTVVVKMSRQ
jgi:hypothetical protein